VIHEHSGREAAGNNLLAWRPRPPDAASSGNDIAPGRNVEATPDRSCSVMITMLSSGSEVSDASYSGRLQESSDGENGPSAGVFAVVGVPPSTTLWLCTNW